MSKQQNQTVLEYLESGQTLTSVQAQCKFDIHRLAARIRSLRKAGHVIDSIPIGGGFVKYELDDNAPFEKMFFEFLKDEGVLDEFIKLNEKYNYPDEFKLANDPAFYVAGYTIWPSSSRNKWLALSTKWCEICCNLIQKTSHV